MAPTPASNQWPFRTNFPKEREDIVTTTVLFNVEVDVTGRCQVLQVQWSLNIILYYLSMIMHHLAQSIWGARCIDGVGKEDRISLLF